MLPIIEIDNLRILDIAKSHKITNLRESKHAKMTGSTVIILLFLFVLQKEKLLREMSIQIARLTLCFDSYCTDRSIFTRLKSHTA